MDAGSKIVPPFPDEEASKIECISCHFIGALRSEWRDRFISQELGIFSLAGMQSKTVARLIKWPWLVCHENLGGCGKESPAKEV